MRNVRGFTLIELMVTVAVLAIALSIAVPSFADLVRKNRAEAQSGSVATALNVARSEAVKRGRPITVTPISGTNWSAGWQVKAGTEVIRAFPALEGATLSSTSNVITFNSRGTLAGQAAGTEAVIEYRLGNSLCAYERDIRVNGLGRVSIAKRNCT